MNHIDKEIVFIKENFKELIVEKNFIGIGSTRKVFRVGDYVIKQHIHKLGYEQSSNELEIYKKLKQRNLNAYIAPILFLNKNFAIQPYYQGLPLKNGESYELDLQINELITDDLKRALYIIDNEFDSFDFLDSGNFGFDKDGHLILIDYGMTKNLYEMKWVPLATAGILPQIYFERCQVCGVEKELRIYGESDTDRRCYGCGKE